MSLQLLLTKKAVTYGLDPVAAAANTVRAEQVTFELQGERVTPQTAKPGEGAEADQVYGEHIMLGFRVPLIGSGTPGVAPKWGPIAKACGWTETIVADTSVTYTRMPVAVNADSVCHRWRDGEALRSHLAKGWRGRFGLELSAGQRPMLVFMGRALHTDVAQAAAVLAQADADFSGWLDSIVVAQGTTTFSFAGVANLGVREFRFEQSDNVKFVDLPGQENVRLVGDRTFTGSFKTTTPLPSVLNYEQKWRTGAVEAFSMVHGTEAGKIVTVNGRAQLTSVAYARENDEDVSSCGTKLAPSSLITDDELSIVLT